MIEVEKKFLLDQDEIDRLIDGAVFISEKEIVDSYYDNPQYELSKSDNWLRKRGDSFELKAPLSTGSGAVGGTNQYREITDPDEILAELIIEKTSDSIEESISNAGFSPFCTCYALRRSYEKEAFTIDIDKAAYDGTDFTFNVVEIEALVEKETEVPAAHNAIVKFANEHHLDADKQVVGKIPAYLEHEKPEHYAALVAVGVI